MSKLSEWVERHSEISQKKFDENDITTNTKIRHMFFEQLENLEFSSEIVNGHDTFEKHEYNLSLRLDFPRKTEAPYRFTFNTDKLTLIPQYTATHRVYRPQTGQERQILTNLGFYLESNEHNPDKANPDNRRDRTKNYFEKRGVLENDVVIFRIYNNEMEADGKMVLRYLDDDKESKLVAYQSNEPFFTVTQEFRQICISRQPFFSDGSEDGLVSAVNTELDNGTYFYVYNIPDEMNPKNFYMSAKY